MPIPNGVGNPGIDPAVPWTTLTVSSVNCGGSCANVAYATISMYGVDGSYWAGDYGPWYRAPTFTLNGGANMVYNPEFGPAYGYNAQGWTTSPAMGACQGAWGGSNPCIANSAGQAGQNTTGLVANQNGGGPSTTGGTTSGQAGGYNSAMSTTNASGAPPKTVVSTSTTYTTSSTTSGTTTYNYRTPVTTTTWSDGTTSTSTGTKALYSTAVQTSTAKSITIGAYIYTFTIVTTTTTLAADQSSTSTQTGYISDGDMNVSGDGQNYVQIYQGNSTGASWASLQNVQAGASWYCPTCAVTSGTVISVSNDGAGSLYFYLADANGNPILSENNQTYYFTNITPTVKPAFDGTLTQTNNPTSQTITSGTGSSAGISQQQQSRVNAWANTTLGTGNSINLDVNGTGNGIYIEQVGNANMVQGNSGSAATVYGDNNNIKITQGVVGTGQNMVKMDVQGTGNNLDVKQARDDNGVPTGTNGHYQSITVGGFGNVINTQQSNVTLGSQYQETTVNGNGNNVLTKQTDNGNKVMFTTVTGDLNTVNATQRGTGQHQLTTNLTGSSNSVTVLQDGSTANKANIDLTNAGGAATLDLQQSGGKNFTIQQSCVNPAGCSTTVRQ